MSPQRSLLVAAIFAAVALSPARTVAAQGEAPNDPEMHAAESATASCAAAAVAGRHAEALTRAGEAESLYRARLARRPNDVRALVGIARTFGQCRIPSAELAQMGELSAESIDLLQRALEIEPRHWLARYLLALNYYRSPPFMRRGDDAARELDRLIEQQGDRIDVAEFARTYEYRGQLWARAGERDSALAVWRRGHRLFPADTALRERLGIRDGAPPERSSMNPVAPAAASMDTVRVVASRAVLASARATPSERVVNRAEVVTTAGGMADLAQAMQLQPGATRVAEGAELFARGGDPAETPTFIDGGRVLSLSRFEGLSGGTFGAIDPFVVRSARFSAGGFSVRHGNALSGVLDIETDSRPRETQWRVGLGLAQAGGTARIPIGARSGAWASLRATHAGALLRTHGRTDEFVGSPRAIEGMAAYVTQPKVGQEVRVLAFAVRDQSARIVDAHGYTGPFDGRGATHGLILSSRHLDSTRPILLRTNLALTDRSTEWTFGVLERDRREGSLVARTDVEYGPSDALTFRAGLEGSRLSRSDDGTLPTTPSVAPGSPVRQLAGADTIGVGGGAYAESEWQIGRAKLLTGVRADRLPGEREVTLDPRISISSRFDAWTARFSAGQFHQGRWRAESAIPDGGSPSGVARQARHLVAGIEREGPVTLRAEGFVKDYGEYGRLGSGPAIVDGRARGVDILAQRSAASRISGWIGYSYLDADVELADGRTVPSPYDVTHTASASAMIRVARGTTLGTTLRYGTGRPVTPILGAHETAAGRIEPVYGEPSSDRLPDYVRLDTRLMQYMPLRRSLLVGYIEVLNVLDRENVSGFVWDAAYQSRRPTHTFYSQRTLVVGVELQSR